MRQSSPKLQLELHHEAGWCCKPRDQQGLGELLNRVFALASKSEIMSWASRLSATVHRHALFFWHVEHPLASGVRQPRRQWAAGSSGGR